jgi:hypothetical protein
VSWVWRSWLHLRLHERRVCPLQCAAGSLVRGDMCVAAPRKPAPKIAKPSDAAAMRHVREAPRRASRPSGGPLACRNVIE